MATLRLVASLALITACVRNDPDLYATFPEPTEVAGPPGGAMDREWRSGSSDDTTALYGESSTDPNADAYMTGTCTDGEIDATLGEYGEWIEIEGYGRVWRPYTTAVGVDFTPYETCGSWVWTEWGWTFACEWDWGWLPFHYGRWGWFDDYWAWVPGYEWSPGWVEWRGGGGYVGWRPLAPSVRDHRSGTYAGGGGGVSVRDHRDRRRGPSVRDHRTRVARTKDWQWRFAAAQDFGKPRIRAHLYKSLAEGLRVTAAVASPPVRATVQPVKADSIMRARLAFAERARLAPLRDQRADRRVDHRVGGRIELAPVAPGARVGDRAGTRPAPRPGSLDGSVYQPTWQSRSPTRASFGASGGSVAPPPHGYTATTATPEPTPEPATQHPLKVPDRYTPTMGTPPTMAPPRTELSPSEPPRHVPDRYPPPQPPVYQPPRAPDRVAPPTYSPPTRAPDRAPPTYAPPARAPERYTPPATSSPPSRSAPTYTPPSRSAPTYSPPARSSAPTYSPPPSRAPAAPGGGFSGARGHRR